MCNTNSYASVASQIAPDLSEFPALSKVFPKSRRTIHLTSKRRLFTQSLPAKF